jgi:putative protease
MKPELLAPAGGYDAALAAFQYGADAVYVGLPRFSARAEAENISFEQLGLLLAYARTFTPAKKVYVTFNTLVPETDFPALIEAFAALEDLLPDGVIVQDLGVTRLIRDHFPSLTLHASTQLAAHNVDGVLALKELGFKRVVLARELSCSEIKEIVEACAVEIEVFVHGALCYSTSGLCLFSAMMMDRSGNRGRCAYCCREGFSCDSEKGVRYPFSMKDLALAPILDKIVKTGAHSLKIEGRMKSPLYVACLCDYYRKKLNNALTPQAEQQMIQDVQTVFSRPWTTLYAEGREQSPESIIDPVAIGHRGARIGEVEAILNEQERGRWLRFKTGRALEKHDGIQVELPGGGKPFGFAVTQMRVKGRPQTVITAPAGAIVELALPEGVPFIPQGTPVFCSASQAVRRRYEMRTVRESELKVGLAVNFDVLIRAEGITVEATVPRWKDTNSEETISLFLPLTLEKAQQPERTPDAVRKAFERLGEAAWTLGSLTVKDPGGCYAPASKLNELRRQVIALLDEAKARRRSEQLTRISQAVALEGEAVPSRMPQMSVPVRILKVRCSSQALFSIEQLQQIRKDFDELVILLEHASYTTLKASLDGWRAACGEMQFTLALPLVSREEERHVLRRAVRQLIGDGFKRWECADLAGWHLLKECGVTPFSADWSLYASNRLAVAELSRLGLSSFVLSPECDLSNMRALAESALPAELLIYQHVPLFISETQPCIEGGVSPDGATTLTDRRGRGFVTQERDGRWITTFSLPLDRRNESKDLPFVRTRVDLSWSSDPQLYFKG